jgi:hypothetical protein
MSAILQRSPKLTFNVSFYIGVHVDNCFQLLVRVASKLILNWTLTMTLGSYVLKGKTATNFFNPTSSIPCSKVARNTTGGFLGQTKSQSGNKLEVSEGFEPTTTEATISRVSHYSGFSFTERIPAISIF